ncbi:hypothetical protein J4476_03435 [Candidatus Woesearchaeota archaeon]|nr:MAG: hypothetical protein QT09_C0006G0002 [archaeon GW2011_AR18]MBS3161721.1 hypothetical protein [Candidatus Woesearchaeota archaeon]HIH25732.1 hypothetical protein [Nanoarchaeota archaeon]
MLVKNLVVDSIAVLNFDSKSRKVKVNISFTDESPMVVDTVLDDNYELFISKLLKSVKSSKKVSDSSDDDILGGISIINISNDEDIVEKAPKRLYMVEQRIKNTRSIKTADEYIKAYHQMSSMNEVIYKK